MTNKSKNQKKKQQKKAQAARANGTESPIANGHTDNEDTPMDTEPTTTTTSTPPPESTSPSPTTSAPEPTPTTPAEPPKPKSPEEIAAEAESLKERGNTFFKSSQYTDAIRLYTQAIDLLPTSPAYLTNRAAAYMALKQFRPALNDCQAASSLQSSDPQAKTLVRLARCQHSLGQSTAALSTLRAVLELEPGNAQAIQLQGKVLELEAHLRNFDGARERKEWALARLALDKCLQSIEGQGGEVPAEWRLWRIELDLARGNWDAANTAANDALRMQPNSPDALTLRGNVLFLSGKLPQALQHAQSALRFDPGHEPAQRLRKRVKDVERIKEEGNTAFKSNKLEEALAKYTEALERIGEKEEEGKGGQIRATLLSNRATTLVKLSRHEEALVDTEASLALAPSSYKALRTRARINLHLEKYDSAIADFKASIQQAEFDDMLNDVKSMKVELKKAEAELKRSKTKDYYKILGVPRDCNELEIKKGYRRESLKHHPDKGGDEEKFKLVVEAHAVLSDPARRERYDLGEDEDGLNDGGGMGGGMGGMSPQDMANLFAHFGAGGPAGFGGGGGGFSSGGYGGGGGGGSFHSHSHSSYGGRGPFGF